MLVTDPKLKEIWADAGLYKSWRRKIQNLLGRLRKPTKQRKRRKQKPGTGTGENGPTKKDAKKILKKYDGCALSQKWVRIVSLKTPTPKDAAALMALPDTNYMDLAENDKVNVSMQTESVKALLTGWKQLKIICLTHFHGLSTCIDELSEISNRIENLELRNCTLKPEVIETISRFRKLTTVQFDDCGVDDAMARKLSRNCATLEDVILWDKRLTSKCLAPFGKLKKLRSLAIKSPNIAGTDAEHFMSKNKKAGWKMERNGPYLAFERSPTQS